MNEIFTVPKQPCPHCKSSGGCTYFVVPESRRTYEKDGEEFNEYFGPMNEYTCANCGCEWAIFNAEDLLWAKF